MPTKRILFADDDIALLKAYSMRLEHAGFEVLQAPDAYQALQVARREKPDLLLLDVHMPAGDGFSVQQRIEKIEGIEDIPVIYLTGDSSDRVDRSVEQMGAFAVLHKPIDKEQLIQTVRAALGYWVEEPAPQ